MLEKLENGVSLDDCAADLSSIHQKSKATKRNIGLSLLACALALTIGAVFLFNQTPLSNPEQNLAEISEEPDDIHINSSVVHSTNCLYVDVRDFDLSSLPDSAPSPSQLALPAHLQNSVKVQAIYGLDFESGEMTRLINYSFYVPTGDEKYNRYIYIGFSAEREPIRELYTPAGELSFINGQEILISHSLDHYAEGETVDVYVADFSTGDYMFNVEAHGLSEIEFIDLLKSLL